MYYNSLCMISILYFISYISILIFHGYLDFNATINAGVTDCISNIARAAYILKISPYNCNIIDKFMLNYIEMY